PRRRLARLQHHSAMECHGHVRSPLERQRRLQHRLREKPGSQQLRRPRRLCVLTQAEADRSPPGFTVSNTCCRPTAQHGNVTSQRPADRPARVSMVILNRIYTRSGDDGTTALGNNERRKKYDLRIVAYGTLDEANATIGLVRLHTAGHLELDAALARIQ